ncbi:Methyltransferase domain-containing protein [Flaviramulus basaltis]|uniref:Methyltransferase domain-containing protein n=1 Tax=Flaviramulus basaltis TaxID=369401 RepID=A0A1K2IK84_9FLAO|nr:class I SAM-dependent methyltransferase [Flaviramulus basaltis]SFZ92820.1 Methyltransferase domain-containing protein [Flaviramulus basaltis]
MQSLYSNGFETIYDDMYQTFINYKEEFQFYSNIINTHSKHSVLEIGCGTGHLAKYFLESSIHYKGLDLSKDMISLSKKRNPQGWFQQGDMTNFKLNTKTASTIITARTTSYLLTNEAVHNALKSIHYNLEMHGILCFDFIDANRFFPIIKNEEIMIHEATINNKHYYRESLMKPNKRKDNFMFHWDAVYFEKLNDKAIKLTEDQSVVRAFTKNEWELFLHLNNFELIEFIDRKSYAFDTYVVVAKRI